MIARISAWWSAWKYVAILGLLLCGSLWMNLHQYGNKRAAVEKARADVYADALKTTASIARLKVPDDKVLLDKVQAIADQRIKRETVYRQAAPTPMDANCAPGQARMDAVNSGVK